MTDITELAQSLKRRATSAKEFGESLYVKADDVLAMLEQVDRIRAFGPALLAIRWGTTIVSVALAAEAFTTGRSVTARATRAGKNRRIARV